MKHGLLRGVAAAALLGAMVAVIKLAGLLDVLPGIGLFALAILSLMMIRIAGRDIRELWDIL